MEIKYTTTRPKNKIDAMPLKEILEEFDRPDRKGFDEHAVSKELRAINRKADDISIEFLAETLAFSFSEGTNMLGGWGLHYGPASSLKNEDGTFSIFPSITQITPAILAYYAIRAKEALNPVLTARYSGLVWDFHLKVCLSKPPFEMAKIHIKALLDIADGDYYSRSYTVYKKLKRALDLILSLKDEGLLQECKEVIIRYEERHGADNSPGLWGYAFDLLLANKKVSLEPSEKNGILQELENKLLRITSEQDIKKMSPHAAESAAKRLADYYFKKNKKGEVKRVIAATESAYAKIHSKSSAMQVAHYLKRIYNMYAKYNLTEEMDTLLIKLRNIGQEVAAELKSVPVEFEMDWEGIDKAMTALLAYDIETILYSIATEFVPKKEQAKTDLEEISRQSPLAFFFNKQLQDTNGRIVAELQSIEKDPEGHLAHHIAEGMTLSSIILRNAFERLIGEARLNCEEALRFIKASPILNPKRYPLLDRAMTAYFDKDYAVFLHMAIPQIEEAIRHVVEISGGSVLKINRSGSQQLKTFDEILRDEILIKPLGEDLPNYLRILFTDQRGWNLRNDICHGMVDSNRFNSMTADRVLHAMLCLGIIRESEEETTILPKTP